MYAFLSLSAVVCVCTVRVSDMYVCVCSVCAVSTSLLSPPFSPACQVGTYKATLSNDDTCQPCPARSSSDQIGEDVCECDPTYIRHPDRPDDECTSKTQTASGGLPNYKYFLSAMFHSYNPHTSSERFAGTV